MYLDFVITQYAPNPKNKRLISLTIAFSRKQNDANAH